MKNQFYKANFNYINYFINVKFEILLNLILIYMNTIYKTYKKYIYISVIIENLLSNKYHKNY